MVGAKVGCGDRLNDEEDNFNEVATDVEIDDDSVDEVDIDVKVDFSGVVAEVDPAWLPEASKDECGGALELPLLLDALALDP